MTASNKKPKTKNKLPTHAPITLFKTDGNDLLVNGKKLSTVKLQAGQTPFYAYDTSVIKKKIQSLRKYLPTELKLHYAVKANPMPAVVNFISTLVDGLDVASGKELLVARNTGFNTHHISFAGPGKQFEELMMAIANEATINIESFSELEKIKEISEKIGIKARVAIRVNPNFELKSSGMKMSGGPQQFGIDAEEVPKALKLIDDYKLHYRGLHIFTGSQNLNAESIIQSHQYIFELADKLQLSIQQFNPNSSIELLNIGGGLGIPYFPGDKPVELKVIGESLQSCLTKFKQKHPKTEVAMELGRYIVGESGLYVCEVIDIKQSRGTEFIIVNGGLHQHLSASGNFGQVVRKNYPVAIGNKMDQAIEKSVQIVGPLCTPLDLLAHQYELPKIELGDLVVIYQSGAYGYTASPKDFLSHPHPIEILI